MTAEHKKNGRPVEGEGWSGGAEEGRGREPPELCARPWRGRAAPWGTLLPRPPSHQVRGRSLGWPVGCLERLNTTRPGVALAPGPASHLPWAGPGASESRAPLGLPSRTPTPLPASTPHAGEHVEVERPPQQLGPSPLAASSASSAPFWPLPPSPLSPPPHLLATRSSPRRLSHLCTSLGLRLLDRGQQALNGQQPLPLLHVRHAGVRLEGEYMSRA